jgi:CheY-like chemotaxis protein
VTGTPAGSTERLPRLLVVEDEAPVRRMLRDVFQSFGYDVVVAASGAEALQLFADGGYDAVVTDLLMPGMNGWEVVARLRHAVPDVPVIMLTGSVPDIDFERVRRERITLVQKPATLSRLRAVLRDVLAGRDAGR